ncbi:MAG: RNA-directed DNA polymerase [Casimicrobium sp.]
MSASKSKIFALSNLYVAYRKAKAEAFYESTHYHAVAFTEYEQELDTNLKKLRARLVDPESDWYNDGTFIGDYAYLPKAIDTSAWDDNEDGHFRTLDPSRDWLQRYEKSKKPALGKLRLVIRPSVDFQVVSVLWIMFVGHLFDATLDRKTSFGNRLRRTFGKSPDVRILAPDLNLSTPGLFVPYFSAYRDWRERGLQSMESALKEGKDVLAMTMDIESFYHRVSPKFLLRKRFLSAIGLELSVAERRFTKHLLSALDSWYRRTPDFASREEGAIPVGLSASKVIANVLLREFDQCVAANLVPIYYGRYVDDIFLVLEANGDEASAKRVTQRIAHAMHPLVAVRQHSTEPHSLTLNLPYAKDSELVFAGSKQKIFSLSSAHGADLVHHIRDQIRQQSSEYRLLSSVPETGIEMASRALLATPNAALQVDALRKADVVSVRRLGFSLLLSDIETYAADLRPETWEQIRREFYGLTYRHLITPSGFFEFFSFIPRVFGLMLSCADTKEAQDLIQKLHGVADLLGRTTTLGDEENKTRFKRCLHQYATALLQSGLQAATLRSVDLSPGYLGVLRKIKLLSHEIRIPSSVKSLSVVTMQLLLADWGRRPYKEYWFQDQQEDAIATSVPPEIAVRRKLRLGAIRRFGAQVTDLKTPHWPALAFPTRPLRVDEIGLVAPDTLRNPWILRGLIGVLRGAEVAPNRSLGYLQNKAESPVSYFIAPGKSKERIHVAVTSVETTLEQWKDAAKGRPDRSAQRYASFNGLINKILREEKRPDYIALPELSVPLRWALRAARKLASNGVSLLTGVEYRRDRASQKLRNDCLVSLTTRWPGYPSSVVILQPKFQPAHAELSELQRLLKTTSPMYLPADSQTKPTVFVHNNFYFSVLICSDLTNVAHRFALRGEIDALFALEWNPDIKTFAPLVEATANDMHAFVVQVNNRAFGDSRIRSPATKDYERDIVQVKGGRTDYYVLGEIHHKKLRSEQRRKARTPRFKPLPIGFRMSRRRRECDKS